MTQNFAAKSGISYEEFREYVDAFKGSSDRARHILYAILVVSLIIAVVTYNFLPIGWPMARVKELMAEDTFRGMTPEEVVRRVYLEQFISNAVWVATPIPGVAIDANDLGTTGGVVLVVLLTALVFYLAREHENLHISLFRVRTLCANDPEHERGDSAANFLYHALAMRQVLSFPPTLARWRKRWSASSVGVVFFIPTLVYIPVVWTNYLHAISLDPKPIGADNLNLAFTLSVQFGIGILLLLASSVSFIISRSMSRRWQSAFERINPARVRAPQMSLWEWLSLRRRGDRRYERTRAELVDTLRQERPAYPVDSVWVAFRLRRESENLEMADREAMLSGLYNEATRRAGEICKRRGRRFLHLTRVACVKNLRASSGWLVRARCDYAYEEFGVTHECARAG